MVLSIPAAVQAEAVLPIGTREFGHNTEGNQGRYTLHVQAGGGEAPRCTQQQSMCNAPCSSHALSLASNKFRITNTGVSATPPPANVQATVTPLSSGRRQSTAQGGGNIHVLAANNKKTDATTSGRKTMCAGICSLSTTRKWVVVVIVHSSTGGMQISGPPKLAARQSVKGQYMVLHRWPARSYGASTWCANAHPQQ
jgi:hypothetical protein